MRDFEKLVIAGRKRLDNNPRFDLMAEDMANEIQKVISGDYNTLYYALSRMFYAGVETGRRIQKKNQKS